MLLAQPFDVAAQPNGSTETHRVVAHTESPSFAAVMVVWLTPDHPHNADERVQLNAITCRIDARSVALRRCQRSALAGHGAVVRSQRGNELPDEAKLVWLEDPVSVGIKVLLLVVLVTCGGLPLVIMIKAEGAVWRIQRASWARMSHKQRVVQGVLVPAWFGVVAVAFVVGYLVSGHAATGAAAAGITALVMIVLGPFVGFSVARPVSKRRSHDAATRDASLE